MINRLERSTGSAIGYRFSGAIGREDYAVLVPEMEALVDQYGSVQLLCDLTDFTSERPSAWWDDMQFGHDFHKKITKMAVVGGGMEKVIAEVAKMYAGEVRYFPDGDSAWTWLLA